MLVAIKVMNAFFSSLRMDKMLSPIVSRYISRALKRTFASRMSLLTPPYEYVQHIVETTLHRYLWMREKDIHRIVVVGAYSGDEIVRMLKTYNAAEFILFEASPRYFSGLKRRFDGQSRVVCENIAVSDVCGDVSFFETNLRGSGSLLRANEAGGLDYGIKQAENYTVSATTLDSYMSRTQSSQSVIDMLWCDVQGAEMNVLRGFEVGLERCRSVFLEVSINVPTYDGGCIFDEIVEYLQRFDFVHANLGVDPLNLTGNAFFIKPAMRGDVRRSFWGQA